MTSTSQPLTVENSDIWELRRCIRDLIALSSLSAIWSSEERPRFADSLADAVMSASRADLVYVKLRRATQVEPCIAIRVNDAADLGDRAQQISEEFASSLDLNVSTDLQTVPDPVHGGSLPVICHTVGYASATGLIAVGSREPGFPSETDQLLCRVAANQAAVAIFHDDNVKRSLKRTLEVGVLEERNRLAREIHDTLAQGLTGIVIQLQVADRFGGSRRAKWRRPVERARLLAQDCLTEARRSVNALRPDALEGNELATALVRMLARVTGGMSIHTEFRTEGASIELPLGVEDNILRIAQEALTNTLRHASANEIKIVLMYEPNLVRLRVTDDGRGFDPDTAANSGFGLTSMRERAGTIMGELGIVSRPGSGTTVELTAPIAPTPI